VNDYPDSDVDEHGVSVQVPADGEHPRSSSDHPDQEVVPWTGQYLVTCPENLDHFSRE
jgi:hypothetical protein